MENYQIFKTYLESLHYLTQRSFLKKYICSLEKEFLNAFLHFVIF
jgi:hypothetical protein